MLRPKRPLEELGEQGFGLRAAEANDLVGRERTHVESSEPAIGMPHEDRVRRALGGDPLLGEHIGLVRIVPV